MKNPSSLNHVMKTASKEKKSPKFRIDGWNFLEANTDEAVAMLSKSQSLPLEQWELHS